jgi:hypothetical protein
MHGHARADLARASWGTDGPSGLFAQRKRDDPVGCHMPSRHPLCHEYLPLQGVIEDRPIRVHMPSQERLRGRAKVIALVVTLQDRMAALLFRQGIQIS